MRSARLLKVGTWVIVSIALASYSDPVEAHLNSTGMGPAYDGLMHFLMSPEDLVPALALALLAGLRGVEFGRRASLTLPAAWLLGSLIGMTGATGTGNALLSSFWFLLMGALVVADARLSLHAMTALAVLLGLAHGYWNGSGMVYSGFVVIALSGLVSGVFILTVLASASVTRAHSQWARVAVRVAGSWIAASGLLMLGWSLRKG